MIHYTLVALVAALVALPSSLSAFSLSPSSWFGGDTASVMGRTHDKSHDVTSNGVTKVQMQYLYKEDWLVTDVDMSTNVVLSVTGRDLLVKEIGRTVWNSAWSGSRLAMTNVTGVVTEDGVVFPVRGGTSSYVDVRRHPAGNAVVVTFEDGGSNKSVSECVVIVRSGDGASVSVAGGRYDTFVGTTGFVMDSGYHAITLSRLAYDPELRTYLCYAGIHRLD